MDDNRIRFDPTEIDFATVFGLTGQDHDNHPAPGEPPRYDWYRAYFIGLLCCQASDDPPTQYRKGTLWHRSTDDSLLTWNGAAWVDVSEVIFLRNDITETGTTLKQAYLDITVKLDSIQPCLTFSGSVVNDLTTHIPVPASVETVITPIISYLRPLVYVNGLLKDPRLCQFSVGCPIYIDVLPGITLRTGDKFTVIIERFDVFVTQEVLA